MNSVKKMSAWFLIFVLFALSPAETAFARDKIITAVYTEWFPYTYTEDGGPKGFEIDIFKAVMETIGYKVIFAAYPWKRCLLNLNSGEADALVSMLKTPEREDSFYFPEENISVSKTVLFAPSDSDFVYGGTLESLKGKSVGVVDGFSYGDDCVPRRRALTKCYPCCTKDEGRPLEAAMQVEASNYRKLRRLRAGVVSVTEKAGINPSSRAQGDERK